MAEKLQGVFAALTTPFEKDKISIKYFRENIKKYNTYDLAGYVIAGSSGEVAYLTEEESNILVKEALEASAPDKKSSWEQHGNPQPPPLPSPTAWLT